MQIGDRVWLRWNGYRGVPKWMSGDKAEIIGFGRTLIIVQPDSATKPYKVRPDQVKVINK